MSAVTTAVNSNTNVRITFSAGNANGESTIDNYKILILQSDGSYSEDTTNCDGTSAAVKTNLYCDIPFTTLIASPYSLTYGTLVQATVQAQNAIGWSTASTANAAGATIQTVPIATPTLARGSSTSTGSIHITWNALSVDSDTGGSAITS